MADLLRRIKWELPIYFSTEIEDILPYLSNYEGTLGDRIAFMVFDTILSDYGKELKEENISEEEIWDLVDEIMEDEAFDEDFAEKFSEFLRRKGINISPDNLLSLPPSELNNLLNQISPLTSDLRKPS